MTTADVGQIRFVADASPRVCPDKISVAQQDLAALYVGLASDHGGEHIEQADQHCGAASGILAIMWNMTLTSAL